MLDFDPVAHEYRWASKRVPGVTTVIRAALGDPFERVARDVLETARQRGKAVHKARELDDAGQLDESTLDERIVPYVRAWREFRQQFAFQVLQSELPRYSLNYGYAGTPDCVVKLMNGTRAVIDAKTGLPGPAAALQTAAYAHLTDSSRRFALQMSKTGKFILREYTRPEDWRDFLACLAVYRLKERLSA